MDWKLVMKIGFILIIMSFAILLWLQNYRNTKQFQKELSKELFDEKGLRKRGKRELSEHFIEKWKKKVDKETRYYVVSLIISVILLIVYTFFIAE